MTAQGSLFRFYVYEKHNPDRIIGTICIHHINRGFFSSCEIGYKFSSACHHMGYATESMQRIIAIAFGELKLHRITAWVLPDNVPSIRLLGRLGFQFEGINHVSTKVGEKFLFSNEQLYAAMADECKRESINRITLKPAKNVQLKVAGQ